MKAWLDFSSPLSIEHLFFVYFVLLCLLLRGEVAVASKMGQKKIGEFSRVTSNVCFEEVFGKLLYRMRDNIKGSWGLQNNKLVKTKPDHISKKLAEIKDKASGSR